MCVGVGVGVGVGAGAGCGCVCGREFGHRLSQHKKPSS